MITVDRGVELLDERLPGWRDEIDPDTLDLSSCKFCILGQVFGNYQRGLRLLGIQAAPSRYGFTTAGRGTYESMGWAWRDALETE